MIPLKTSIDQRSFVTIDSRLEKNEDFRWGG